LEPKSATNLPEARCAVDAEKANLIDTLAPPFETAELREQLAHFLDQDFHGEGTPAARKIR